MNGRLCSAVLEGSAVEHKPKEADRVLRLREQWLNKWVGDRDLGQVWTPSPVILTFVGCLSLGKLIPLFSTVKWRWYFLSHTVILRVRERWVEYCAWVLVNAPKCPWCPECDSRTVLLSSLLLQCGIVLPATNASSGPSLCWEAHWVAPRDPCPLGLRSLGTLSQRPWAGPSDSLLTNRRWLKWWDITSVARLQTYEALAWVSSILGVCLALPWATRPEEASLLMESLPSIVPTRMQPWAFGNQLSHIHCEVTTRLLFQEMLCLLGNLLASSGEPTRSQSWGYGGVGWGPGQQATEVADEEYYNRLPGFLRG